MAEMYYSEQPPVIKRATGSRASVLRDLNVAVLVIIPPNRLTDQQMANLNDVDITVVYFDCGKVTGL